METAASLDATFLNRHEVIVPWKNHGEEGHLGKTGVPKPMGVFTRGWHDRGHQKLGAEVWQVVL